MKVYKIKNKDGLFSRGGHSCEFTKRGKTWNSKAALNNHISQIASFSDYHDCTIIEFTTEGVNEYPALPWIQEVNRKYFEKHKKRYGYYRSTNTEKEADFIEHYTKFLSLKVENEDNR